MSATEKMSAAELRQLEDELSDLLAIAGGGISHSVIRKQREARRSAKKAANGKPSNVVQLRPSSPPPSVQGDLF